MCNFFGTIVSKTTFIKLKQIEKELGTVAAIKELERMKDGFKYSNSAIVRKSGADDIEIVSSHWEFIAPWIKDMEALKEQRKKGIPWLNAKAENLFVNEKGMKSMWADAAEHRRCLVLASYFFEWQGYKPEGAKKENKYPYMIGVDNAEYFYMAGIWQPWTDKQTGETMDTFAIVTTEANELMAEIHNSKKRMPTILPEDLAYEWIMKDLTKERITEIAKYKLPSDLMNAHTISKDFKILEDPTEPFEYAELPELDIAE